MVIPNTVKIDMNEPARKVLIDAGKHFMCLACFFTLPVRYRSEDDRYCLDCYQVINEKDTQNGDRDTTGRYAKIDANDSSAPSMRGRGRPRKEVTINVVETSKTQQQLARESGVSQSTISRRRADARPILPAFRTLKLISGKENE